MDFQTLKRRALQSLCKLNNIPANTTNASMADALASLPTVEGLEEFLVKLDSEGQGSPERSVNGEELEGSKMGTRTRCRTRTKAVEGTDTRKTPATRTTRKRASQVSSVQKKTEKDMQAEFEADMEQSGVTENNDLPGFELKEISEEVSGVSVETEAESKANDGEEVIDLDDSSLNEVQEEDSGMLNGSIKVDFHSLVRKDLQNLCKKNKIPANTSNASMADALGSLEIVVGLQDFLQECDSQAPMSPAMSGITSSCARRSRTTMKVNREEPQSSKMITKSCRGSRRRIVEEAEQGTPAASSAQQEAAPSAHQDSAQATQQEASQIVSALCEKELVQKNDDIAVHETEQESLIVESSEVSGGAKFNGDISNSSDGLLNVLSKIDESVVEEESLKSMDIAEVYTDLQKVETGSELLAKYTTQDGDLKFGSTDCELENIEAQKPSDLEVAEYQEDQFKNLVSAATSDAESLLETLDNINAEEQIHKEFTSVPTIQADKQSFVVDLEGSDTVEEVEGSCTEDKNSDSEPEDKMFENSDSEATIQDDQLSLETNVEIESEMIELDKLNIKLSSQFDTESTIEVRSRIPTDSKTPINLKSLRKLKKMVKEKLQEKTLAQRMEKLSLAETEILATTEDNLQEDPFMPGFDDDKNEDNVEESEDETNDGTESDNDSVEQKEALQESDGEIVKLNPVEILMDNEVVCEDAVLGEINVVTCPPQVTPSKCSSMTKKPTQSSSCKTPMSAGRKTQDFFNNKENIDNSISKTEPGKIKLAISDSGVKVLSAMSMGKLKKEFKVLQQSDMKRPLQPRSENQCLVNP